MAQIGTDERFMEKMRDQQVRGHPQPVRAHESGEAGRGREFVLATGVRGRKHAGENAIHQRERDAVGRGGIQAGHRAVGNRRVEKMAQIAQGIEQRATQLQFVGARGQARPETGLRSSLAQQQIEVGEVAQAMRNSPS